VTFSLFTYQIDSCCDVFISIFNCVDEDVPKIHDRRLVPHIQHIEMFLTERDNSQLFNKVKVFV
jgi:hypothetical protein